MEVVEYRDFLDQYRRAQVTSLESRLGTDGPPGTDHGALVEDPSVNPQTQANLEELRSQLVGAISELEERERLVATFYFYEGLTLIRDRQSPRPDRGAHKPDRQECLDQVAQAPSRLGSLLRELAGEPD